MSSTANTPQDPREPYQVEVDSAACRQCGVGWEWHIIGPGGIAGGTSYDDEEAAQAMADALNEAYREGTRAAAQQLQLTGQQVLDLARFVIPAWVLDAGEAEGLDENARQQLDVPVTVAVDPPTAPPGTWAWCSEYPEEGAVQLGGE